MSESRAVSPDLVYLDREEVVAALQALHDIVGMQGSRRNKRADAMATTARNALIRFNCWALTGVKTTTKSEAVRAWFAAAPAAPPQPGQPTMNLLSPEVRGFGRRADQETPDGRD